MNEDVTELYKEFEEFKKDKTKFKEFEKKFDYYNNLFFTNIMYLKLLYLDKWYERLKNYSS